MQVIVLQQKISAHMEKRYRSGGQVQKYADKGLAKQTCLCKYENYGWEVSANSAKPPIFADEYLVSETERIFEVTIKEPIIITVDVELPRAEKQFEISSEVFMDFLMTNGYLGKMKMFDVIELSKEDGYVKFPNLPTLTKEMILASLSSTRLSFADLEEYLDNIAAMKSLIDLGIETPPLHKIIRSRSSVSICLFLVCIKRYLSNNFPSMLR